MIAPKVIRKHLFDPKRFVDIIGNYRSPNSDGYAVYITDQASSLALPILIKNLSPLSRCIPIYFSNTGNEKGDLQLKAVSDYIDKLGYDLKTFDVRQELAQRTQIAGLNIEDLKRVHNLTDGSCLYNEETYLKLIEEYLTLEYSLQKRISNVLYPGDLEQDFCERLFRLPKNMDEHNFPFLADPVLEPFVSSIHPMISNIRKLRPLAPFERESIVSSCTELVEDQSSVKDSFLKCLEHTYSDRNSKTLLEKFVRIGTEIYGASFNIKYVSDQIRNVRELIKYMNHCIESVSNHIGKASLRLPQIVIPLKTNVLTHQLKTLVRKNPASPDATNKPIFSFLPSNRLKIPDSDAFMAYVFRMLLSSVTMANLDIRESLDVYNITKKHLTFYKHGTIGKTDKFLIRFNHRGSAPFEPRIIINKILEYSDHDCHNTQQMDCPINEVVMWNKSYYLSVMCDKLPLSLPSKLTLERLQEMHYAHFFSSYRRNCASYLNLESSILPDVQDMISKNPVLPGSAKFLVRNINADDFTWLCDQLSMLIKHSSSNYSLLLATKVTDAYKNIMTQWEIYNAGHKYPLPVVELRYNKDMLEKSIVVAVPALNFHFYTPDIKIIQVHVNTVITENYKSQRAY